MIISCQNCFARYTLPDGSLPLGGRKVRCSSCSNVWLATPEDNEAQDTLEELESEAESESISQATADKLSAIRAAMVEDASHIDDNDYKAAPLSEDKLNIEEETDELDPDNFGASDNGDEDVDMVMEGGVSDPVEIDERFADDPSHDDLGHDDLGHDDLDDDDLVLDEHFAADDFDDEDFDDDVITRRRRKQREEAEYRATSRRSQMAAIGWVFLFLLFATIIGLFFMIPGKIVSWWPAAGGIYDLVGVSSEPEVAHADVVETPKVRITPYASSMIADGEIYKLTLSGKVVNEGLRSITIPEITYRLINAEGGEISKGYFCLPNRILRKSQSVEFEHIISPASVDTAKADFEIKWEKDIKGMTIDKCASQASGEESH